MDMSEEEAAYKDLIAGSSSDEDDELSEDDAEDGGENASKGQKRIEEMRMKLLGGLSKDKPVKKRNGAMMA